METPDVRENIECSNIRLFQWNDENILSEKKISSDSEGLAVFIITNVFETARNYCRERKILAEDARRSVVAFDLSKLSAPQDENLGLRLIHSTGQFSSSDENSCKKLGEQISGYLFSRFQIDDFIQPGSSSTSRATKTVIIIEVLRIWSVVSEYRRDSEARLISNRFPRPSKRRQDPWLESLNGFLSKCLRGDESVLEILPAVRKCVKEFDKEEDVCTVCLQGFVDVAEEKICITSCFHVFHKNCVLRWLYEVKDSCPTCRLVLPFGFKAIKRLTSKTLPQM